MGDGDYHRVSLTSPQSVPLADLPQIVGTRKNIYLVLRLTNSNAMKL